MNFNYQKFSMERRLNDAFDPLERRIRIVNAVQYEGVYLYTEAEDNLYFPKTRWLYGMKILCTCERKRNCIQSTILSSGFLARRSICISSEPRLTFTN
jgi:hypothetical protein